MKVKMQEDYRKFYTLDDADRAKMVINYEKDDETSIADWAKLAAAEAMRGEMSFVEEVLKAEAHTAKNSRAWNLYGVYGDSECNTGDMDVWIDATAKTSDGFLEIGAYLSDIWGTGATPYKHHMYIQRYKRV